jgi:predicted RNA polymerase sigma factor
MRTGGNGRSCWPPRAEQARSAYEEALLFTENEVERAFLLGRIAELG